MLAQVNGVFRLVQDVELKYLNDGTAIAKLNLVNSDKYKTKSGEQREDTCFIEGSLFGRLSEIANQYLKKGSKVFINGSLKMDSWDDKTTGQKRNKHTLKINSFEMLDAKSDNQQQSQAPQQQYNAPQQQQAQRPQVQQQRLPDLSIEDDSIPFAPLGLQYPNILHSI